MNTHQSSWLYGQKARHMTTTVGRTTARSGCKTKSWSYNLTLQSHNFPSRSHDYLDSSGSFKFESSILALSCGHCEPLPGVVVSLFPRPLCAHVRSSVVIVSLLGWSSCAFVGGSSRASSRSSSSASCGGHRVPPVEYQKGSKTLKHPH
jgi:hypothetical protein